MQPRRSPKPVNTSVRAVVDSSIWVAAVLSPEGGSGAVLKALVPITGTVYGCRDPNDDGVIEAALRGGAAYLVTGDKDLAEERIRELLALAGVRVVTVAKFLAELETGGEHSGKGSATQA